MPGELPAGWAQASDAVPHRVFSDDSRSRDDDDDYFIGAGTDEEEEAARSKKRRSLRLFNQVADLMVTYPNVFSLQPRFNVTYNPVSNDVGFGVVRLYLKVSVWHRQPGIGELTDVLQKATKTSNVSFSLDPRLGLTWRVATDLILQNRITDKLRLFRGYRPLREEGLAHAIKDDDRFAADDDAETDYALSYTVRGMRDCQTLARDVVRGVLNAPNLGGRSYEDSNWFALLPPVNAVFVATSVVDNNREGLPARNIVTPIDL